MIKLHLLNCVSVVLLCLSIISANAKDSSNNRASKYITGKVVMDCIPATAETSIEVNEVRATLSTAGNIFFKYNPNPNLSDAGYEVPKGEGKHSIYAGALWIGALDDDNNLKLAAQTYRQRGEDFWPGPLDDDGKTTAGVCDEYDRFWSITKKEVDAFAEDFADGTIDSTLSENLNSWAGPFVDADGNNVYNPLKGDYPQINGDEAVWYVINDKGNEHTATTGSVAMGLEIQTLVYGFNTDELKYITFSDYTLINRSSENLKKAYLGTWLDPDLGNYKDDFVGCDTLRNLGICYNGDELDEDYDSSTLGYGENPPFIGIQILNGIQTSSGKKLGMSGFVFYNNSDDPVQSDPDDAQEHYNYLIGKWKDGTPITYGGNGFNEGSTDEVPFMFPSDPSDAEGWSECAENIKPDDRRFLMATGPFDMQPGVAKKMTQSVLWVRPEGAFDEGCPSFKSIQNLADEILLFYDTNLAGDDIAPEITINGDDFVSVELGADWTPPTATAEDNVDGEVEVIIDTGGLDLNANGAYDITYTAVDSNGNSAERTVTVVVGTGVGIFDYAVNIVSLQPNPVFDWVSIDLSREVANLIQIFDLKGQLVFQSAINKLNTTSINLIELQSGVYLSKISNQGKVVSINKLIKQ